MPESATAPPPSRRQKLTVRLPKEDLDFLKRYAAEHGITATEVIDRYLRHLRRGQPGGIHPEVKRFSGIIPAEIDAEEAWRQHTARKHAARKHG